MFEVYIDHDEFSEGTYQVRFSHLYRTHKEPITLAVITQRGAVDDVGMSVKDKNHVNYEEMRKEALADALMNFPREARAQFWKAYWDWRKECAAEGLAASFMDSWEEWHDCDIEFAPHGNFGEYTITTNETKAEASPC